MLIDFIYDGKKFSDFQKKPLWETGSHKGSSVIVQFFMIPLYIITMCQTVPKCANFQTGTTKFCNAEPCIRCTVRIETLIRTEISSHVRPSK